MHVFAQLTIIGSILLSEYVEHSVTLLCINVTDVTEIWTSITHLSIYQKLCVEMYDSLTN